MKKLLSLTLCLLLLLTACTKSVPTAPSTESTTLPQKTSQDVDNTFLVNENFTRITQSESTIYKLASGKSRILYYDKATGISGPLCGKPDCSHTGTDCNAYAGDSHSIQYYDGSLYFVAADTSSFPMQMCLWKCDPSGENRVKIRSFDYGTILTAYQPQQYYIHRGVLYLLCTYFTVSGTNGGTHAAVLSLPLDDSDDFTVLWEQEVPYNLYPHFRFFDKYLYICTEYNDCVDICRLNTETREIEPVFTEESDVLSYDDIAVSDDGTLYLAGSDRNVTGYVWIIKNGKREQILTMPVEEFFSPEILDGCAVGIWRNEEGKRVAVVKTFDGKEIYNGLLFPEVIPEMPEGLNDSAYGIVGGNGTEIMLSLIFNSKKGSSRYIASLDAANNMKATIVWHIEDT